MKSSILSKFKIKKNKNPTHVFMDGGKLHIPADKLDNFYKYMTKQTGDIYPPLVEVNSAYGYFKFYLDIDNEDADLKLVLSETDKILKQLFENKINYNILKRANMDKYHIIYDLKINKSQCMDIVELLKNTKIKNYIDMSAYSNGLRIANSYKHVDDKNSYYADSFNRKNSILYIDHLSATIKTAKYIEFLKKKEYDIENKYVDKIMEDISLEYYRELADCLSIDRLTTYDTWIKVMLCLKNCGYLLNEDDYFLDLFLFVSSKVPTKYNKEDILKQWNNVKHTSKGLSIGTLIFWAREDDSKKCNDIIKKFRNIDYFDYSEKGVCDTFYHNYKNKFVFTREEKTSRCWKYFNGNKWKTTTNGSKVQKYIMYKLIDIYKKQYDKKIEYLTEKNNGDLPVDECPIVIEFKKFNSKMKTNKFTRDVIKLLENLFLDEDFLTSADTNNNLIGFENGVYDLENFKFRKQIKTDRVLMSTGYSYNEERDEEKQYKIKQFLTSIMPDEKEKQYLLTILASSLKGGNKHEIYPNFEGTGGNGKGTTVRLLELCLGNYIGTLPVSILTSKRQMAGNHSSCLHKLMKKRVVVAQEPEKNVILNAELMKELTGGDKIEVRQIYGESETLEPQFTLFMQCNNLPDIDDDTDGSWRRFQLIKFRNSFKGSYKKVNLKELMSVDGWGPEFFHILADEYKKYVESGNILEIPESLQLDIDEFKKSQNAIQCFLDDSVEKKEDGFIKATDLYNLFKEWVIVEQIDRKYKRKDFIKEVQKILSIPYILQKKINGKNTKNIFYGICMVENDEESDDDNMNKFL